MMTIMAPFESPTQFINLIGPEFNNTIGTLSTLKTIKAKDNTRYTYVKRRSRLKWTNKFRIDLEAGLKLQKIITENTSKHLRVTTSDGDNLKVYCTDESFTLTGNGHRFEVSLTFEGELLNAATTDC